MSFIHSGCQICMFAQLFFVFFLFAYDMFHCFFFNFDFFKVLVPKIKFLYFFTMMNRQEDFFYLCIRIRGKNWFRNPFYRCSTACLIRKLLQFQAFITQNPKPKTHNPKPKTQNPTTPKPQNPVVTKNI